MVKKEIKLAEDTIDKEELQSLSNWILEGNRLTKGALTPKFEEAFSNYLGCKYSVFVNSGSSANLLMYYGLIESNRLKNNKVIVPAISWVTTLSPAIQFKMEPILCDADPQDLGLDVAHFEQLCKLHRPSMAILVHVLGHANKMKEIRAICEKYDVLLIEDACEALGSEVEGTKLGNFGLASSFSFYYGHHISTIEGGIVCTNDRELYNILLSIRSHGWGRDIEKDYMEEWKRDYDIDEFRNFYTFYYPGFNLRSSDLNAFLGLSQLEKMEDIVKVRLRNFEIYKELLGDSYWCQESDTTLLSSFSYGTYVENRLETFKHLKSKGIESRPLVCGSMGRQPFWIKKYGETPLEVADKVHYKGLYLPNHANITPEDIEYIAKVFKEVAKPIYVPCKT